MANETLGTSTRIGLLEAANELHEKEKEIKTTVAGDKVSNFRIFLCWNQIRNVIYSFL